MRDESLQVHKTILSSSPFGPVAAIWKKTGNDPWIVRILISRPGLTADREAALRFPQARPSPDPVVDRLVRDLGRFLEGKDVTFALGLLDWDRCSPFQQAVLIAEHGIPRGRSYRSIARHLCNGKGARAVGNALAKNPFPLIIPCHRAIRSDGSLGGFQGGTAMKRRLLEMEGISFDASGRVIASGWFYDNGM